VPHLATRLLPFTYAANSSGYTFIAYGRNYVPLAQAPYAVRFFSKAAIPEALRSLGRPSAAAEASGPIKDDVIFRCARVLDCKPVEGALNRGAAAARALMCVCVCVVSVLRVAGTR
jgi:hypothetical protein